MTLVPFVDRVSVEFGGFDGPLVLTCGGEFRRGQVPEGTVGSVLIVIYPPRPNLGGGIGERDELLPIQTLVPQPAVERFDVRILHGFARSDEVELDAPLIRPVFEGARHEFGAVVDRDRPGGHATAEGPLQHGPHILAGEPKPALQDRTLATPLIDHREHPKRAAVKLRIVDEIHAPPLM